MVARLWFAACAEKYENSSNGCVVTIHAVVSCASIEHGVVVKRTRLPELGQGQNCCVCESVYDFAPRIIDPHAQYAVYHLQDISDEEN